MASQRSVAIISKPGKPDLKELLVPVLEWFAQRQYQVRVDRETAQYHPGLETLDRAEMGSRKSDFVLVLGGDGTLLAAARAVAQAGIPILGVNLGSLGFLTEVPMGEIFETLVAVDQGQYAIEKRSMLRCSLMRNGNCVAQFHALNEAVVNKSAIARLVSVDLYLDGNFVSNYKGDGVIVATPTGSTAYSLAAGGPILMPTVDALVISPVCPHSLTHRPLVVQDTAAIEVIIKGAGEEAFLSIDGQEGVPVMEEDRLQCRKAEYSTQLMRTRPAFFEVLQTKLKWGVR